MFTGIITDVGRVRAVTRLDGRDLRLAIETGWPDTNFALGASIACSGVCLTVVDKGADWFAVDVSGETIARSTAGDWGVGRRLNLERALKLGDELGGHIVAGHVDGLVEVVDRRTEAGSVRWRFRVPRELARFVAPKGSVALDGVSLTVNEVMDEPDGTTVFGVNIIPHTAAYTTFGTLGPGDRMNFEVDTVARYLDRMLGERAPLTAPGAER